VTAPPPTLAELLVAECQAVGIVLVADGDNLIVRGPREDLTPVRLAELAARKAEILAWLADRSAAAVCRCGSTAGRDFPIHGGRSTRRDCARCGRFLDFPRWHERGA